MKRLTQWYDDGKIRGVLVKDGYEENSLQTIVTKIDECYAAVTRLKEYEDTGLTPPEIMELVERDTAKKIELNAGVPICPVCGRRIVKCYDFCPDCGQRLEHRRNDDERNIIPCKTDR